MSHYKTAYLLTRLTIGTSFFGHGLVRLPKLDTFVTHMAAPFEHSILPHALVVAFGYVLPFVEFGVGLLLLPGLFTRQAAIAGIIVMMMLIFGSTSIENFGVLDSQLIHAAFLIGLLIFVDRYDYLSVDLARSHSRRD